MEFKEGMRVKVTKLLDEDASFNEYVGRIGTYFEYEPECDGGEHPHGVRFADDDFAYFAEDELVPVNVKVIEGVVSLFGDDYYIRDENSEEHCITQEIDERVGKRIRVTVEDLD